MRDIGYSSNCIPEATSRELEHLSIEDGASVVDLRLDREQGWERDLSVWASSTIGVVFVSGEAPVAPPGLGLVPFRLVVSEDRWRRARQLVEADVASLTGSGRRVFLETHWSAGSGPRFARAVLELDVEVVADTFGLWRMLDGQGTDPGLSRVLSERTAAIQVKGVAPGPAGWRHCPIGRSDPTYLDRLTDLMSTLPRHAPILIESKAPSWRADLAWCRQLSNGGTR